VSIAKALHFFSEDERHVIDSFVEELKKKLGNELVSIRLFGSKARGDFKEDSDIDMFILVREKTPEVKGSVRDLAATYVLDHELPLSIALYDLFEYQKNTELGSFFFENVEKEGIAL